jgi:hypothetical protein
MKARLKIMEMINKQNRPAADFDRFEQVNEAPIARLAGENSMFHKNLVAAIAKGAGRA